MPADKPKPIVVRGWVAIYERTRLLDATLYETARDAKANNASFKVDTRRATLTIEPKARKRNAK